jgi:hypothetical protein
MKFINGRAWWWRQNPGGLHDQYDNQPWQVAFQVSVLRRGHQNYEDGPKQVFHLSKLRAVSYTSPCGKYGSSNRPREPRHQTIILHSKRHCREGIVPSHQWCHWAAQPCRYRKLHRTQWVQWHILMRQQLLSTHLSAKVHLLDPYKESEVRT